MIVVWGEEERLGAGELVRVLAGDKDMLDVSETVGEAWEVDETLGVNETVEVVWGDMEVDTVVVEDAEIEAASEREGEREGSTVDEMSAVGVAKGVGEGVPEGSSEAEEEAFAVDDTSGDFESVKELMEEGVTLAEVVGVRDAVKGPEGEEEMEAEGVDDGSSEGEADMDAVREPRAEDEGVVEIEKSPEREALGVVDTVRVPREGECKPDRVGEGVFDTDKVLETEGEGEKVTEAVGADELEGALEILAVPVGDGEFEGELDMLDVLVALPVGCGVRDTLRLEEGEGLADARGLALALACGVVVKRIVHAPKVQHVSVRIAWFPESPMKIAPFLSMLLPNGTLN